MSGSFTYLRWALLGLFYAIVIGFGVTEAVAKPQIGASVRDGTCPHYRPYRCMCDEQRYGCAVEPGSLCVC